MLEAVLGAEIVALSALLLGAIMLITYRKRLVPLIREYKNSRGLIETLTVGLHRRIADQSRKLEEVRSMAEAARSEAAKNETAIAEHESRFEVLVEGVKASIKAETIITRKFDEVITKLESVERRGSDLEGQIKLLDQRYLGLLPETETASALPVHGESALSQLTPTEILILSMLLERGPSAVAEIRMGIGKTREHTARLMKKLHENVYVERDTSSIPYKYKLTEKYQTLIKRQPAQEDHSKTPVESKG